MKKSEPKMILNVAIENDELDEKIKIAMDQYIEKLAQKHLDDAIAFLENISKTYNEFGEPI